MYSPEARQKAIQRVLEGLANGTPLAVLCRDEGMPDASTVRGWCDEDENLAIAYARARELGFDVLAAECMDIADETGRDTIRTADGVRADSEWISRSKLRVETRLKLLAKWDPKRYGDATTIKHADADGEKLALGEVERATRLAAILAAAEARKGSDESD